MSERSAYILTLTQEKQFGLPSPKSQAPSYRSGLADTKRRSPITFYDKSIQSIVKNH